jgi:hypothetical protein
MASVKARTKPPPGGRRDDVAISFRVSVQMAEALDQESERVQAQNPGLRVTRSEIARMILHNHLEKAAKK